MNIEDELRAALRREEPSLGFTQRVVARAQPAAKSKWFMPRMIWAAAVAVMLVVGFTATVQYRQANRQKQAERAGREAVQALRITAVKLNNARDKVLKLREN
jgi:hypothetical protein